MSETIKKADKNTIEVMLVMTEKCNLNCRYCYEDNKSKRKMDPETAKKIIDKELAAIEGSTKKLVVQFFGGEPTLEWNSIVKIYEYVKEKQHPNMDYFFVVTNGTTFSPEMKKWSNEHREDFICGLSLDGTREIHNFNRSNSYDLIDFDFFKSTWPKQKVKMTISPDMLPHLAEGVKHCHSLGFGVLCNLADGMDWKESSTAILQEQLEELIQYYIEHKEYEPCSILKMPLLHVALSNREQFPKWCGCGDHIHAYDVDGNLFPCQLFMNLTAKNLPIPKIKSIYSCHELMNKCQDCPIMGCCPTCMGTNIIRGCSAFYHTPTECANIKVQFLATSALMYYKWHNGQLNIKSEEEEALLLRNIEKIQIAFG